MLFKYSKNRHYIIIIFKKNIKFKKKLKKTKKVVDNLFCF